MRIFHQAKQTIDNSHVDPRPNDVAASKQVAPATIQRDAGTTASTKPSAHNSTLSFLRLRNGPENILAQGEKKISSAKRKSKEAARQSVQWAVKQGHELKRFFRSPQTPAAP